MTSPTKYINERKSVISKLQRELRSCSPMNSPLLRAESKDSSIALVPGFDVDLRPEIEKANIAEGQSGGGYVIVMGKPFATSAARRTTSPIRTTTPHAQQSTTAVCNTPNPLEPVAESDPLAEAFRAASSPPPSTVSRLDEEMIAGSANRHAAHSARRKVPPLWGGEEGSAAESTNAPYSPRREPVNAHPLDGVDDISGTDMREAFTEAVKEPPSDLPEITIEAQGRSSEFEAEDVENEDLQEVQELQERDESPMSPAEARRARLLQALAGSEGPTEKLDSAISHVAQLETSAELVLEEESGADAYKRWAQQAQSRGRAIHVSKI